MKRSDTIASTKVNVTFMNLIFLQFQAKLKKDRTEEVVKGTAWIDIEYGYTCVSLFLTVTFSFRGKPFLTVSQFLKFFIQFPI